MTQKPEETCSQAVPQEQLPPMTISLKELSVERERYNIRPSFQREDVWEPRKCQALIDTILLGDPIPAVEGYLEYGPDGETLWIIIDGHQRISAILGFIDGRYKTWSPLQKARSEPNSRPPVQPSRFFAQLDVHAKNYFLDYRLQINKVRNNRSHGEMITRFLRIQNHTPLTAAERLRAYPSKARDAARLIEQHEFWDDFYDGKGANRGQIFQSSLYLLAIELSGDLGFIDLQSTSFLSSFASGLRDDDVTETLIDTVLHRLDSMCCVYTGTHFTERSTSIPMYQSVMLLESVGYTIKMSDRGALTDWMMSLIEESKQIAVTPGYHRPIGRMPYAATQRAFWERHRETVLRTFNLSKSYLAI